MLQTMDQIPLWAVFLITTLILFTAAEIGFHLGKWRKQRFQLQSYQDHFI
jgi:hypothetical protein